VTGGSDQAVAKTELLAQVGLPQEAPDPPVPVAGGGGDRVTGGSGTTPVGRVTGRFGREGVAPTLGKDGRLDAMPPRLERTEAKSVTLPTIRETPKTIRCRWSRAS
jgi:hypothetical protein